MAKLSLKAGSTSKLVNLFAQDSSSTTGAGLTGLAFGTSGLTVYYLREGAGSSVAITLATMTLGTWATGGFIVTDATNMPGVYQLGIPDAALASGAKSVIILLKGATNLAPVVLEIELTAVDNQDAVRGGMSALPNGSTRVKKNATMANFPIYMVSSADHVTPKTGLGSGVTAQRSLDGAAFAACANAVSEIGLGWYVIALATTDTNADLVLFEFTAASADATAFPVITQP
jgi:hypothetical protein